MTVNLGAGTGSGGDAAGDTLISIENVIGSALADRLTGSTAANVLTGGAGNDVLVGTTGADTLDGGDDVDTADFSATTTAVTLNLTSHTGVGSDGASLTLLNLENLTGGTGNDTLTGDSGVNVLTGNDGDDTLIGAGGADVLVGGNGINTASYFNAGASVAVNLSVASITTDTGIVVAANTGKGDDAEGDTLSGIRNLTGSGYDDYLVASSLGSKLDGGAGNDILVANSGSDNLIGGGGVDTANYSLSNAGVSINLLNGTASGGYAAGDTLSAIQNLVGSASADTLRGDNNVNSISGGGSDDIIEGRGGGDTLDGGAGNDTVSYENSSDLVTVDLSAVGAQTSRGDAAGDTLINFENILGSRFDDTLTGTTGINVLTGGQGNDTLIGLGGADTLDGSVGTDTASYAASTAGVTVNLGAGTGSGGDAQGDTLISIENVIGSALADTLTGSTTANVITGGAGDDTLIGTTGADTLDGGDDVDTADFSTTSGAVTLNLTSHTGVGSDGASLTLLNLENLTGGSGNDILTGDAGINVLTGNNGDDTLIGGGGADVLIGGIGINTASYFNAGASVSVNLSAASITTDTGVVVATNTGKGDDAEGDTLSGIRNLTGSGYNDYLVASTLGSKLDGGAGNDILVANSGADTLVGGGGVDTANYALSNAGVTIDLFTGAASGGYAAGDTLTGIQNLVGTTSADTLRGDNVANTIRGGDADDLIEGRGGADILDGGVGNDTVSYENSTDQVTVNLSLGTAQSSRGDASGDILSNFENLTGSKYDDTLTGSTGVNNIKGGAGNDILIGGGGADTLDGGADIDTADFSSATNAVTLNLTTKVGIGNDGATVSLLNIENLAGGTGNDTLTGDTGANVLTGNDGDDLLIGGAGADVLAGGAGINTASYATAGAGVAVNLSAVTVTTDAGVLVATGAGKGDDAEGDTLSGIRNLIGSNANDFLVASSLGSRLDGGIGNDILVSNAGSDTLIGGGGADTASYILSNAAVSIDLLNATASGGYAAGDTLTAIQNLIGSASADTLRGDTQANTISGGAGDDTIEGRAGADKLDGGDGNDTVSYENSGSFVTVNLTLAGAQTSGGEASGDILSNFENILGSRYDDILTGNAGVNVLTGGQGNDLLVGGAGADILDGGADNDTVSYAASTLGVTVNLGTGTGIGGDAQDDTLISIENVTGSNFADRLTGTSGANIINGGSGNDVLVSMGGADTLDGGADIDTADFSIATTAVTLNITTKTGTGADGATLSLLNLENLTGGTGNDTLTGDSGINVLISNDGDDLLIGGGGADVLTGGAGINTASYATAGAGVAVNLSAVSVTTDAGIVVISGAGKGDDAEGDTLSGIRNLTGSNYNDFLVANSAGSMLDGGTGNDILVAGAGADTLTGGGGTDTANYSLSGAAVSIDLLNGTATGGYAAGDTLTAIQNLVGSASADTLRGDNNINVISGGGSDDVIEGRGGADTLDGGAGNDTVSYASSGNAVTVDISRAGAQTSTGDASGDILSNFENIVGSDFNDTLTGTSGINVISGGQGNDLLIGGAGADVLDGGADTDTVSYAASTLGVTVNLGAGTGVGGDAQGDTLISIENVTGSNFADRLTGTSTANVIVGGAGNDILIGMGGADTLDGGDDIDTADFSLSASTVTLNLTTKTGIGSDGATVSLQNIENLTGGSANDTLTGDTGANVLTGNDGDDLLIGAGGADVLVGGNGVNTASYATAGAGVAVNLAAIAVTTDAGLVVGAGSGKGDDAEGDTLSGIRYLVGSNYNDFLVANLAGSRLDGGTGNDVLVAGAGSDQLIGGGGVDTANYSLSSIGVSIDLLNGTATGGYAAGDTLTAIQNLVGGSGADTLRGDNQINTISGGNGDDIIEGRGGADILDGGVGNDTVSYENSGSLVTVSLAAVGAQVSGGDADGDVLTNFENITGSNYNDTLTGDDNANKLSGGQGNDLLIGGKGGDTLDGGAGTDTASYATSVLGVTVNLTNGTGANGDAQGETLISIENLIGSAADDRLTGSSGVNNIFGGAGNDVLVGTTGADILDGGDNIDTVDFSAATTAVSLNLVTKSGIGTDGSTISILNIENLTGGSGNDTLTGDSGANTLIGNDGDDTLIGGGGADVLNGGNGFNATTYVGAGASVLVNASGVVVTTDLGVILAAGSGKGDDAEGDTLINIRNITGSNYNDFLVSNSIGGTLNGGTGDDVLVAGQGADILIGGGGNDTVKYSLSNYGVTVDLLNGTATGGYANGDTLSGITNLVGSTSDDTLRGDNTVNTISGDNGDDTIEGRGGSDILDGGDGNDTVSYANSGNAVTIDLGLVTAQSSLGDASGDVLTNFENITGSDYNDVLTGTAAANTLTGGKGDDLLIGLGGGDVLDGGAGNDTVTFAASTSGVTVNLGTGYGSNGDAQGDTFISVENVIGSGYDDILTGSSVVNSITGGAGNDSLFGAGGNDTLDGGDGTDTADYSTVTTAVNFNLTTKVGTVSDGSVISLLNMENLTGGTGNDTLTGDTGANVLTGNEGDDLLIGGAGADTLIGGAGNNTASYATATAGVSVNLYVFSATNTSGVVVAAGTGKGNDAEGDTLVGIQNLIGSDYNDYLVGSTSGGKLDGGTGNDYLVAATGADNFVGGADIDTVSYGLASSGVTVNLLTNSGGGTFAAGDTYSGIENIDTTNYNDVITGDTNDNVIRAFSGEDLIDGGGGNDYIDGGAGVDTVSYASATSAVVMRNYNGIVQNTVSGGTDTLVGIDGMIGSNYSDITYIDSQNYGGSGVWGGGNQGVSTGNGNDYLYVYSTNWMQVNGGAGTDTVHLLTTGGGGATIDLAINSGTYAWGAANGLKFTGIENLVGSSYGDYLAGDTGVNALTGGDGNDTIRGGGGDDVLFGGNGNDLLVGGAGADTIIGGAGTDTASWDGATVAVNASLMTNLASGGDGGTVGTATAYSNANLIADWGFTEGTGTQASAANGSAYKVTLNGGAGWASGLAGHGNALSMNGAASGNYATVGTITMGDAFSVSAWVDFRNVGGGAQEGIFKLGTANNQSLVLTKVADGRIMAEIRGDLYGAVTPGQTTAQIYSAAAVSSNVWTHVVMTYQAGRLQLYTNGVLAAETFTSIILPPSAVFDSNFLGIDSNSANKMNGMIDDFAIYKTVITEAEVQQLYTQTAGLEGSKATTDTLNGIENLTGTNYDDTLTGDNSDNVLTGGLGNDTLVGNDGNDMLIGGDGNDVLTGGNGTDTASYAANSSAVTVSLATNTASDGDVLSGIENIIGSVGNDTITGNTGDNTLAGGFGNDTINGGDGNDIIYGDNMSGTKIAVGYAGNLLINGDSEGFGGTRNQSVWVTTGTSTTGWHTATETLVVSYSEIGANGNADNKAIRMLTNQSNDIWQSVQTTYGQSYTLQFDVMMYSPTQQSGGPLQILFNGAFVTSSVAGISAYNDWTTLSYTVTGTGGTDKIEFKYNYGDAIYLDNFILAADGGKDTIDGGLGDDQIFAGGGSDTITSSAGNNTVDGGTGYDTIVYTGAFSAYTRTYNSGNGTYTISGATTDTTKNVERFSFTDGYLSTSTLVSGLTIVPSSTSIAENSAAGTQVGTLGVSVAQSATYAITGGADATAFTIVGNSLQLSNGFSLDYETKNSYSIQVTATTADSSTHIQTLTISVTDVNDAPIIVSNGGGVTAAVNAAENQTAVTTVTATDQDPATTLTYSIVGGADQAKFAINSSTGVLTFISAQNFENPTDVGANNVYDVQVQVSDGTLTDVQSIAVTITNVNEAPTISSNGGGATAAVSASENQTAVTTVIGADVDAGTTFTYSISGGADAAKFAINATTGVLTFVSAPNFEIPTDVGADNVYNVQVRTSDGALTAVQDIAVTVTNVNEAPTITSNGGGATASVNAAENQTAVTTVVGADVDAGSTLTYSIVGGADQAKFAINASTGVLTFVSAQNFESPTDVGLNNVYDVQVRVSDGTLSTTQSIAVTITNVNEAPTITSNGGGATSSVTINENSTAVTTVTSADVDAGTTFTYSISGGADSAKFTINASTGVLTFLSAPNFESPTDVGGNNVYDVQVRTSDGTLTAVQDIAVTVANINDAPTITSNGGAATASVNAAENQTAVTTVVGADQDAGATLTYSIIGGADAAKFAINSSTGVLTFVSAQNFESPTDVGANNVYDVTVQVSDGTLTTTQAIAVTMTNVNEAPTITSNGGGATAALSISENGTAVTTVTSSDVDAGTTFTYSIAGGADAAKFSINSSTGVLTFISAPNFESPTDVGGNNVYDVQVRTSDGALTAVQDIAITVTNVNEAPTITSNGGGATASVNAAENQTAVTTVVGSDPDAGATLTYSIVGGADQAKFAINSSTGVLTFVSAQNFESPTDVGANNVYDVQVRVSDGTLTTTQSIAVTMTNVNEAPTISSNGGGASASISMTENLTAVTTVTGNDVDAGTTLTYSISGGADQSKFTINASTGALTFISAPNFESPTDVGANNVYDVQVQTSDGSLTAVQNIAVTITNINDAPTITSNGGGATASINAAENQTSVTTVVGADQDAGATLTYSISGGADAAKFSINSSTGVLTFISAPNFEAPTDSGLDNIYNVQVRTSDGTLTAVQDLAVTVTNVNEAPTITSSSSFSIVENSTAVATVTATDPDAGATKNWSISGTDAALFSIDALTGALAFITAPDYEHPADAGADNTYNLLLSVTDGTNSVNQNVAITVTNQLNETVNGTNGNDNLYGGPGNDTINGLGGDDTLDGGAGNDTLNGGAGNDHFLSGAGNDIMDGGTGTHDWVDYSTSLAVNVNLLNHTASGGDAAGDTLTNIQDLTGSGNNDVLTGDTGNNIIHGGGGNDTISGGGGGTDFLYGDAGNDTFLTTGHSSETIDGGVGKDTVMFSDTGSLVLTGISGVETLDFRNSGANTATITSTILTNLGPEGDILTVNRDMSDTVTLSGATDTHTQITDTGVLYDVYTMLDDHAHQVEVHVQAA